MSSTPLIALVDLYEEASAASAQIQIALSKASKKITEAKLEATSRTRCAKPDQDLYDVLQDALNILDAAINHEDRWKSAGVVPMLRILHGRIRETLNKSQTGGGSIH